MMDQSELFIDQPHRNDPQWRIDMIRRGISAARVAKLAARLDVAPECIVESLRLPNTSIPKAEMDGILLSSDASERVLGVEALIGLVQTMVEESGDPDGFDAGYWLGEWLFHPLPALGGATPASYLDTFEGQRMVAGLLVMMESGEYA